VRGVTGHWWSDDGRLLAALDGAVRAARDVPERFVEAGKAEYTWRTVDAELAALTYDSALEEDAGPVGSRSEPASLRALTFVSPDLTVELDVTQDAVLGQVVPPGPGQVEIRRAHGRPSTGPIDDLGCFTVRPLPDGMFRLRCRMRDGADVLTGWLSLD
jgi:hypothetical protein